MVKPLEVSSVFNPRLKNPSPPTRAAIAKTLRAGIFSDQIPSTDFQFLRAGAGVMMERIGVVIIVVTIAMMTIMVKSRG